MKIKEKIALANRLQGLTTRISKRTMDITDDREKRQVKVRGRSAKDINVSARVLR